MLIGIVKENHPGENRSAFIPSSVDRLVKKGAEVSVEAGLGNSIGATDADYQKAGAKIDSRSNILKNADIVSFKKDRRSMIYQIAKSDAGDGEQILARIDDFSELVERQRQRQRAAEGAPGPPGLEADAGDPPAQP